MPADRSLRTTFTFNKLGKLRASSLFYSGLLRITPDWSGLVRITPDRWTSDFSGREGSDRSSRREREGSKVLSPPGGGFSAVPGSYRRAKPMFAGVLCVLGGGRTGVVPAYGKR